MPYKIKQECHQLLWKEYNIHNSPVLRTKAVKINYNKIFSYFNLWSMTKEDKLGLGKKKQKVT